MDGAFLLGLVKEEAEADGESTVDDGVTGVAIGEEMDGRRANGVEGAPAAGLIACAAAPEAKGELICGDSPAAAIDTRLWLGEPRPTRVVVEADRPKDGDRVLAKEASI
jgi:hypothetical protein